MKKILFFWLVSLSAFAQSPIRLFRTGDQITLSDSAGGNQKMFSAALVSVEDYGVKIRVTTKEPYRIIDVTPSQLRDGSGAPYSSLSVSSAISAFRAATPISNNGGDFGSAAFVSSIYNREAEGMPLTSLYGTLSGTLVVGQTGSSSGKSAQPGEVWRLDNIVVTANDSCGLVVQLTNSGITTTNETAEYYPIEFGKQGGVAIIPIARKQVGTTGINFSIKRSIANGNTNFKATFGTSGLRFSADYDKPAERIILKLGDSFLQGSGISYAEQEWDFMLADSLQKYTGKKWRIISRAKGGYTSSNLEAHRQQKTLSFPRVDVILYAPGTNDASASTYDANLAAMLNTMRFEYPNAVFIAVGPATRIGSQETINAAIRSAAQTRITNVNHALTKYFNAGSLWTQAQQSTYTVADQIHANPLGHSVIANGVWGLFIASARVLLNAVK